MKRKLLVLDSNYRTNPEEDASTYKFKIYQKVKLDGIIRLEQFVFQNSQYVFNEKKHTNRFIYREPGIEKIITLNGMFDNADSFVKDFNQIMTENSIRIMISYRYPLYEFKIQHLDGIDFELEEYYSDGKFFELLGFEKINQGASYYTNTNVPKLFSQKLTYIAIPELGTYNLITMNSRPYTFIIFNKPGFEIVSNINNTFANEFPVDNKELDEFTVKIIDSDGFQYVNNKGNANFTLVLSYEA